MDFRKPRREAARYCKNTWRLVRPYRTTYRTSHPGCSLKGENPKRDGEFFIFMMKRDVKAFYQHRVNYYFNAARLAVEAEMEKEGK